MVWLPLLTVAALVPATPTPQATDDVRIQRAWIATGLAKADAFASDAPLRAPLGADVRLYLVVEATVNGRRRARVFTEAPRLKRRRRTVRRLERWPEVWGALDIAYFKLEPDPLDGGMYDNTGTMEPTWHPQERAAHPRSWHWCTIDYTESACGWGSVWQHRADAVPTTTRNYGGLGTMRYVARVRRGGKTWWTPGKDRQDRTGLTAGIATIQLRRDDTPVGYMTELLNVPYVYGSSSSTGRDRDHQTERAVGADCADLVVYGWRRAGRRVGYTWTGGLKTRTRRRALVTAVEGGRYRTGDGRPIAFGDQVAVGDLLLWNRHVAVIASRDPSGFLTPETLILHTVVESAALVPLKEAGFGYDNPPFDVRR